MVERGTTITWEAWDGRYKPNQDWNHAWGAAPANLLPRFVPGAQPLAPGWKRALIQPHPGPLEEASGKIPTELGPILMEWKDAGGFKLSLVPPPRMRAQVDIPARENSTDVAVNGKPVHAKYDGQWWTLEKDLTGSAVIETR